MTGILDLTADDYHADRVNDQPSLSASVASLLVSRSPKHAWAAHPKLNPAAARIDKAIYDIGHVAHSIILEGTDRVQVVDAADWRTKDAKEQRDEARANGRTPLLANQYADVCRMVEAVQAQLAEHDAEPPLFTDGKPEQTLVWDEDGVVCRARCDWLQDDCSAITDLKTTSKSAHPRAFERNLFTVGCDVQAAFYLRGLAAVTGTQQWAKWRWVVVETQAPFALSVIEPAADVLELGNRKVEYALTVWRDCLERDVWPAYSTAVEWAHAPEWEIARWLEREEIAA